MKTEELLDRILALQTQLEALRELDPNREDARVRAAWDRAELALGNLYQKVGERIGTETKAGG